MPTDALPVTVEVPDRVAVMAAVAKRIISGVRTRAPTENIVALLATE